MIKVNIITSEKALYTGTAKYVILPSTSGEITILAFHQPLVSRLTQGPIKIDKNWILMIKDGLAGFDGDTLEVIAEL